MKPLTDEMRSNLAGYSKLGQRAALRQWEVTGYDIAEFRPLLDQLRSVRTVATQQKTASEGWTEAEALEKAPCVHRGAKVGEWICTPCQGRRVHTIFACALHGVCTARAAGQAKWEGVTPEWCFPCEDRSPKHGGDIDAPGPRESALVEAVEDLNHPPLVEDGTLAPSVHVLSRAVDAPSPSVLGRDSAGKDRNDQSALQHGKRNESRELPTP